MKGLPNVRPELEELGPWREKEPLVGELRSVVAERAGIAADEVMVGQAAAALFGAVANAFAARTSRAPAIAMTMTPSLQMYKWVLRARGMKLVEVPLESSFRLDVATVERALDSIKPNAKLPGFSVTTSFAHFLRMALAEEGKDAAEVFAAAKKASLRGLSGRGIGRVARRLRIEVTTAEDATRVVDLLKGLAS